MSAPDLVFISPSVQVIADYDEPIFYSSNYYWRNDGAVWYRSTSYTSGWARVDAAPAVIMQIDRPSAYIHYHAQAGANTAAASTYDQRAEGHEHRDEKHDDKAEQKRDRDEDRKDDHKGKSPKGH